MEHVGAEGTEVTATALNDYRQHDPAWRISTASRSILAMKRDGEDMPIRDKGPLFIVYPYDSDPELAHGQILQPLGLAGERAGRPLSRPLSRGSGHARSTKIIQVFCSSRSLRWSWLGRLHVRDHSRAAAGARQDSSATTSPTTPSQAVIEFQRLQRRCCSSTASGRRRTSRKPSSASRSSTTASRSSTHGEFLSFIRCRRRAHRRSRALQGGCSPRRSDHGERRTRARCGSSRCSSLSRSSRS